MEFRYSIKGIQTEEGKMKHLWKKVLSMVLIAALLIQVLPATAKGAELTTTTTTEELEMNPQTGLADMYEYLTYNVGKAGTIYFNTYTGKIHVRRTDLSLGGERLPLKIEFYYDPVNFEMASFPYGAGWSTSYNQLIKYDSKTSKYCYKNENGTWIYFVNSGEITEDGYEIWKEDTAYEIGKIGTELYRLSSADVSDYTNLEVVNLDKTYTFNENGRLYKVSNGIDEVCIIYTSNNPDAIQYVIDHTGRRVRFMYSGSFIYDIKAYASDGTAIPNTRVNYTIRSYMLTAVSYGTDDNYADSIVNYEYNAKSELTQVKNEDDCGYAMSYGSKMDILSEIVQLAAIGTSEMEEGEITTIEHSTEYDTLIKTVETQQAYVFDRCGRTTKYTLSNLLDDGSYQSVYGYTMTYDFITNEDGIIINDLVDIEYYDVDGVIEETEITEDIEVIDDLQTENSTEVEENIEKDYFTTEDAYGNILTETNIVGDLQQIKEYNYIFNGNFLSSVTDVNGSKQQYIYDYPVDKPTGIIDGNGNKTSYTYNSLWELASVQMNVSGLKTLTSEMELADDGTSISVKYIYEKGRLTTINYGDCVYTFTYDKWGNILTVSMGTRVLVTYDYGEEAYKGLAHIITYGNGQSVYYTYNSLGQVVGIGYTEGAPCFKYSYGADGELETIWDIAFQRVTQFTDKGYKIYRRTLTTCREVLYEYEGTEENYSEYILGKILEYKVENDENISWLQVLDDAGVEIFSEKVINDGFDRLQEKLLTVGTLGITQKYGYITNGNVTGNRVSDYIIEYKAGSEEKDLQFLYTYDGNGNILSTEEKEQNISTSNWNYTYDEAGQLTEAYNSISGIKYKYTYDQYGNLVCTEEYSVTEDGTEILVEQKLMCYDGMILLKSYSTLMGETTYRHDTMGNIIGVSSKNGIYTFTWGEGRSLLGISGLGYSAKYIYNDEGLRIIREVKQYGKNTYIEYEWGKNGLAGFTSGENTVVILYGQDGTPIGFSLNDTVYTYIKNLQGDVIRILDTDGNTVVEYTYDPWGVPTITGDTELAAINPCSYRCYDYDEESGYYYLQSRYYNPQTGRFLNADDTSYLGASGMVLGYNLFTYCDSNPVNYFDPTGKILISTCVIIGIGIGGLLGGVVGGIYGYNVAQNPDVSVEDRWKYVVGYGLGGFVVGGVIGGFMGYGVGFLCGASSTSGIALKAITKSLSSISQKTWSHIIVKKHAWDLVLTKVTQNGVKNIIKKALQKGTTTLIKQQVKNGTISIVYESIYSYLGQKIVVHYAVIDGLIKISDAWVKTR